MLACEFPLGRPLGKPGDAAFQHRVLQQAFNLLEADEPIFEHFPGRRIRRDADGMFISRDDLNAPPAVDEARGLIRLGDVPSSVGCHRSR